MNSELKILIICTALIADNSGCPLVTTSHAKTHPELCWFGGKGSYCAFILRNCNIFLFYFRLSSFHSIHSGKSIKVKKNP